jgi:hypothetical protein
VWRLTNKIPAALSALTTRAHFKTVPGPAYTGALGAINTESIDRQQQVWLNLKAVPKAVPIDQIIDRTPLQDAYKLLGIKVK